jgi:hypothetical protein
VPVPGGFTRPGAAGANAFRFTGRLSGRRLRPGRYRLLGTPVADGLEGAGAGASFRILPARRSGTRR